MAKGYQGQSCSEAIRESFTPGEVLSLTELFKRVQQKGNWKEDTICQHIMQCVFNLMPARFHWNFSSPFLFVRPDGQY